MSHRKIEIFTAVWDDNPANAGLALAQLRNEINTFLKRIGLDARPEIWFEASEIGIDRAMLIGMVTYTEATT